MNEGPSPALWSTVPALPDYLLPAQTRQLALHEQALQILVLDHLREIEARRLHLSRGGGAAFGAVHSHDDRLRAGHGARPKRFRDNRILPRGRESNNGILM